VDLSRRFANRDKCDRKSPELKTWNWGPGVRNMTPKRRKVQVHSNNKTTDAYSGKSGSFSLQPKKRHGAQPDQPDGKTGRFVFQGIRKGIRRRHCGTQISMRLTSKGGWAQVVVGHPFDTLKYVHQMQFSLARVRLQTNPQYTSAMDCARKTVQQEGVRVLASDQRKRF